MHTCEFVSNVGYYYHTEVVTVWDLHELWREGHDAIHQVPSHAITDTKAARVSTCCKRAFLTGSKHTIWIAAGESPAQALHPADSSDRIKEQLLRQSSTAERAETASSVSEMVVLKPKKESDGTGAGSSSDLGVLTPSNPMANYDPDRYNEHGQELVDCKFCTGKMVIGTEHCEFCHRKVSDVPYTPQQQI